MTKIALINGSPKNNLSASKCLLDALSSKLFDCSIHEFSIKPSFPLDISDICEHDIFVFAFPLYVDGIPSHLLNELYNIEQFLKTKQANICVYAIINCGFYEGEQTRHALKQLEHWCLKSNITWCNGLGIGGGGMLSMLKSNSPLGGPMKNIVVALNHLANLIIHKETEENSYISPNFPRILYKLAAEIGWRQQIKTNGLKSSDLYTKK